MVHDVMSPPPFGSTVALTVPPVWVTSLTAL